MNERIRSWIARPGPMFDFPRLIGLYHLLSQVLAFDVAGEIVELGCHEGQSAVLFRETMDFHRSRKELHLYDSFQGLPEAHEQDVGAWFRPGELRATHSTLSHHFAHHGLEAPIVHPGWFCNTLPAELPDCICFAHVDCDFYASILLSLVSVYDRLANNAIVVIDDYDWEGLPGVKRVVDDFLRDKPEKMCTLRSQTAFRCAARILQTFVRTAGEATGATMGMP